MTMLIKYDVFSEDVTRFYMAECILAIEAVHNLGYIHRCVTPFVLLSACSKTLTAISNLTMFSSTEVVI
jgi:serine/threonine protein kinase